MLDLYEEFRSVIGALEAADVPYALCGGLAVALHARPRATQDIDLLVKPDQVDRVKEVLKPLGYGEYADPMTFAGGQVSIRRLGKMEPGGPDLMVLDLLLASGTIAEEAWTSKLRLPWEGGSVMVVSREALIALKRLRGSALDGEDIKALENPGGMP